MDFFALIVMLIPAILCGVTFALLRKKIKSVAYIFLGLGILLFILIFSLWLPEVSGKQLTKRFESVRFFQRNTPVIPKLNTPDWEYWVLAQSNLAQGLYTYGTRYPERDSIAKTMVSNIAEKMVDEANFPFKNYPKKWSSQALYLSHLNIVLAINQAMNEDERYADLNKKISNYLAQKMISSPYKNTFTAGKSKGYFPAENTVILESLRLTDAVQKTNFLERTYRDWKRFVKREVMYNNNQLPCTNFDEMDKCKLLPQSPYLCWTTNYIYHIDPDFAKEIWHQTKFFYRENTLLFWTNFKRYHPDDTPPAYGKNNPRPLEVISPNITAKLTAAMLGNRLTYFQLNNLFALKDLLNGTPPITQENYWEELLNTSLQFRAECL